MQEQTLLQTHLLGQNALQWPTKISYQHENVVEVTLNEEHKGQITFQVKEQ